MKDILLTITLTLLIGGQSTFAADTAQSHSKFRFAKLEATETSWDYTSIIYDITDATGHSITVAPTQISYIVRDKSDNDISAGKGVYVSINDTRLQSEEDYSITITATIKKDKLSAAIYRKASPKKLVLRQQGNSYAYQLSRAKYTSPTDYEPLTVAASSMSVSVAFANCRDCASFKVSDNASHTTLTDANSYKEFENTVRDMTQRGKKVQLILQPTISHKGSTVRYAQSYYEVSPASVREIEAEPATADKDGKDSEE